MEDDATTEQSAEALTKREWTCISRGDETSDCNLACYGMGEAECKRTGDCIWTWFWSATSPAPTPSTNE